MHRHRLRSASALGLALAALVAAPGIARAQDLRSPDTREHSPVGGPSTAEQAPIAPINPAPTGYPRDLRTPDSRDAAEGRGAFSAPDVMVVRVPQRSSAPGGIDWRDAGFGAGTLLGLIALGLGATFAVYRRRHGVAARRHVATSG